MARAEKYITDLNTTKWKGKLRDWYYGKKPVRRGYYLGNIIYNNAQYELEVPNTIEVEATGGNDALNLIHSAIISRKTDVDGKLTDLTYRIVPEDLIIPPNTTTEPIFVPFTIILEKSDLSVTVQYKLNAPSLKNIFFSDLTITNVYYDYGNTSEQYISASGGTALLMIEYSATKTILTETTLKQETIVGIASNINIEISDHDNYSHVTFYNNGDVYAESLRDNDHSSTFELVRIKKLNISVDFINEETGTITTLTDTWQSASEDNDIVCYQQYNLPGNPIFLGRVFTVEDLYVDPPGGIFDMNVTSYNRVYYVYTSTYQTSEIHTPTGGRIVNNGGLTVSPEAWATIDRQLSVTVEKNHDSNDRYFYITITNGYEEKTATVTQYGSTETIVSYKYKNIRKAGSLGIDIVSAIGGVDNAVDVSVDLIGDRYAVWSDGSETIDKYNYGFSLNAIEVTGKTEGSTGGATIGGKVYADNRGTNYDENERHVFTIETVKVDIDGSIMRFDGYSHKVLLEENIIIHTSNPTAVLNCSKSSFSYDARGGLDSIKIDSYYQTIFTYSSLKDYYEYEPIATLIRTSNSNVAYPSVYATSSSSTSVTIYTRINTSTSDIKSATITITQSGTNKKAVVDISVGKNYYIPTCTEYNLHDVYTDPSGDIPASGGTILIKVKYRKTCGDVSYADGSWENEVHDDIVYNATSLTFGSTLIGTVNGGEITVGSRGTDDGDIRLICIITGGKTSERGSFSCNLLINQQANNYSDSDTQYFSISPSSCTFDAKGGTEIITVNSYLETYRSFTSGDGYLLRTTDLPSTIYTSDSNIASISSTVVSGKNKTFTITVSKNTDTSSTRSATITVELNSTKYSDVINVFLEKDYLIEQCTGFIPVGISAEEIPASGGSTQVVVTYTNKCNNYSYATGQVIGQGTSETKNVNATSLITNVATNIGTVSGGVVSVDGRGTEEDQNARIVYNITGGTTALGSFSLSGTVYQSGNTWEDSTSYTFTSSPTSDTFDAKGGTTTVTVTSYSTITRTFASGQSKIASTTALGIIVKSSNTSVASIGDISGTTTKTFIVTTSINTNTSDRSAIITITQDITGTKLTLSISLEKDYTIQKCTGNIPIGVYAEEIPASGGTVQVKVLYKNTCGNYSYATGELVGNTSDTYQTVDAISLITNTSENIGTALNGKITANSRKDLTGDRIVVYSITGGSTSLGQFSLSGSVYQSENRLEMGDEQYVYLLSGSIDRTIEASVASDEIIITSYTKQERSYTSNYPIDDLIIYRNCTASIVSGSSFTSLNTTTSSTAFKVTFSANVDTSSRVAKIKITNWEGVIDYITYTQNGNVTTTTLQSVTFKSVVFDTSYTGTNVPASGGSATISVLLNKRYVIASAATGTSYNDIEASTNSVTITGSGSATVSNNTINVSSLYDNVTNSLTTVYTISKVGWSYKDENNKTWSDTTTYAKTLQLDINSIEYGVWLYTLSASTSQISYTAAAANPSIDVTSTRYRSYTYTSEYKDESGNILTENYGWKASITSGYGSVTPTNASAGTTRANVMLTANTSTTSIKTTTVKIENAYDGTKYKTFTFTQTADKYSHTNLSITVYSATAVQADASGNTIYPVLTLKSVSTPVNVSGVQGAATTTYPTATVSSILGSVQNSSGAYISGTGVVVKNAGTNRHDSVWTVFTVTKVSGTYNNTTYDWSGTLNIQQAANTPKTTYQPYQVTGLTDTESISSVGGSFNVDSTCVRPYTVTWTSGSPGDSGLEGANATVSGTNCTVSPTSFNNSGTITATVGENTSAARTCSVKITSPTTSIYKTVSVTQNQVVLNIIPTVDSVLVPANGENVSIICTSTRNGVAYEPKITSNQSWASVGNISQSGSTYIAVVSVGSHTNTSSRLATITLTTTSGTVTTTKKVIITQSEYVVPKPTRIAKFNGIFQFGAKLNLSGPATIDYTKINMYGPSGGTTQAYLSAPSNDSNYTYTGGSNITLRFVVSSSTSESGKISESSLTGISVTKDSTTTLSLINLTSTSAAKYVLVYLNGTLYETCMIMVPST